MAASNHHSVNAHDNFRREHLLHLADSETAPALKIVLGTLFGALLALAGILSGPPQSVDRFAQPEELARPQTAARPGLWPAEVHPLRSAREKNARAGDATSVPRQARSRATGAR